MPPWQYLVDLGNIRIDREHGLPNRAHRAIRIGVVSAKLLPQRGAQPRHGGQVGAGADPSTAPAAAAAASSARAALHPLRVASALATSLTSTAPSPMDSLAPPAPGPPLTAGWALFRAADTHTTAAEALAAADSKEPDVAAATAARSPSLLTAARPSAS